MAAKRIGIMDIRQLIQLKIKGLSNRKIEQVLGIHRNTINEYVRIFNTLPESYEQLYEWSDDQLSDLFARNESIDRSRYEILSSYFEHFTMELKKTGCTRQALWNRYIQAHPDGYGRSQFNEHLRRHLQSKKISGKLIHKSGEKLFVDYAGKKLSYVDKESGELIEVKVFIGILPCSMMTYVEATPSERLPDFIESTTNCLEYFGGVPQAIVTDNLKSAVSKGSKYEPVLNKTFKDFAVHYGTVINPTRVYAPQDKALVEGAVRLIYQRIFYKISEMTFFSIDEINVELRKHLERYNDYLITNIDVSRRHQFQSIERESLTSLPSQRYEIKEFRRATVQKMGYVYLSKDKNYYSAPYRYIGKKVELRYNRNTVEIYYNKERIALHKRSYRPGRYNTIEDHLSSTHRFYKNWSPEFFKNLARPHGDTVVDYIGQLIEQAQYPEIAYKQCLGVLNLADKLNPERLEKACKRAMLHPKCSFYIVKSILDNHMENQPTDITRIEHKIPKHENVRGSDHYKNQLQNCT